MAPDQSRADRRAVPAAAIPPEMFRYPVDYEKPGRNWVRSWAPAAWWSMDDDNCMVDAARYFIEFHAFRILRKMLAVPR